MHSLAVVVPTLNEAELLPRLLDRLSAGPREDRADRVIVSDGGSEDSTIDLARDRGACIATGECGRGRQLARGAREANEDLLLFLHADSLPAPGALRALRAAYDDPTVSVTAMRQRIEARGRFYRWVESAADARSRRGVVYGDSGLGLRRAVYERIGGFRDLALFEDLDISRRLRERWRVHHVPAAELSISARRWKREGPLRTTVRNWILRAAYLAGRDPEHLARYYSPERASTP